MPLLTPYNVGGADEDLGFLRFPHSFFLDGVSRLARVGASVGPVARGGGRAAGHWQCTSSQFRKLTAQNPLPRAVLGQADDRQTGQVQLSTGPIIDLGRGVWTDVVSDAVQPARGSRAAQVCPAIESASPLR